MSRSLPASILACVLMALPTFAALAVDSPADLARSYTSRVDLQLNVPQPDQTAYAVMLERALEDHRITGLTNQFILLVDCDPRVQAVLLFWRPSTGTANFIGASPVSTGRPGGFEHFETPTGVFVHSLDNPDSRAQGTENELGIYGYGAKGMRVYDFGWVQARRTWGKREISPMRLQMHSTDPRLLEQRLGTVQSLGCIRIPASHNDFLEHYGILDAAYEEASASGKRQWVLARDRAPTPWSGRYLVIVDSGREQRPPWAPLPALRP
jgi:hypothetical protein